MRKFSFLTLLTSLLIVGCTEVTIEQSNPLSEINSLPDLTASFADEGETRTFVEDSKYLRWHESDLITAFFGNTLNRQYKFKGKTGDNSGTFSLVSSGELGTGNDLSSIYAVYPYDENTTITDNGVFSLTLPATQTYAENSFGKGANTMVAVTESVEDTFLSFKNACGYLKLKLYGDNVTIASIEVTGNNEEKIAGSATATMEFGGVPTIAMNDEATTSVTLDCGEGVSIGATADMATEFWIVLPETTFEGGITITATNTDGAVFSKSTTNTVVITRNDIQPMVALKAEFATAKPANNEIWYTNGSTTEATTPYKTNVFGANIISNTYDADMQCWVIKFDGDVTTIGDNAFYNCSSLTTITIPDSVTSIGSYALSKCSGLTSITIPNSVTSIGSDAFSKCSGLTSITIPDSVTSIGSYAFNYCTGELIVNCNIPSGSGNDGAFYGSEFTSVTIGDSVTTIGGYAFYGCSSLTSITIPDSVTTIEWSAFRFCDSLTSVTISDSVTSIGSYAFSMCTSLQEFKGNLASEDGRCLIIGGVLQAFAPAGITEYTIPDGVTAIGPTVFNPCPNLTSVTIPDSVTSIGDYAFGKKLTSATIGNGVTSIGDSAFRDCSSLTSVTIPDSVTTIGDSAFYGCTMLTSITIPDSVTTIGYSAFSDCTSLTNITIGNSITTIGEWAFADCTSLTGVYITDITAWNNILFEDATSNPLDNGGDLYINNELVTDLTIPDSITTIGDHAFRGCSSLTSITIPNSVTKIGDSAFRSCDSLASVTIPDSVTEIGKSAFYYCESLTSVYCKATTPPSLGGSYVFDHNASSRTIYVPKNSVEAYKTTEYWSNYADYIVGYNFETGEVVPETPVGPANNEIWYTNGSTTTATTPYKTDFGGATIQSNTYNSNDECWVIKFDKDITAIGYEAFKFCSNLESVYIPTSVELIDGDAFYNCSSLKEVYCMPTTPPDCRYGAFPFDSTIYVPSASVSAYKSAPEYWTDYTDKIVGYDF